MIIAMLVSLNICGLQANAPIDANRLAEIRESLESYLSRIDSLIMDYELRREPKDAESAEFSAKLTRSREARYQKTERAEPGTVPVALKNKTIERSETLFMRRADMRLDQISLHVQSDGTTVQEEVSRIFFRSRDTQISHHNKTINIQNTSVANRMAACQGTPLPCIGMLVPGADGQQLPSMLNFQNITTLESTERVSDVDTIAVKVGPNIPENFRPTHTSDKYWVKLWLAPSLSFLPIKAEYHYGNGLVVNTTLGDFRPVTDLKRKETLQFPHSATYKDMLSISTYKITEASVNRAIASSVFEPSTPIGFVVQRRGEPIPSVRISGGKVGSSSAFREQAKKAKDILSSTPAPASERNWPQGGLLIAISALLLSVTLFLLKRRRYHA